MGGGPGNRDYLLGAAVSEAGVMPRIVVLAGQSRFAKDLLDALLDDDIAPAGVIIPGWGDPGDRHDDPRIPVQPPSSGAWAHELAGRGLPVHRVQPERLKEIAASVDAWEADMLVSICFPYRLPNQMISDCPCPIYNVHTSLLPRYRGPAPLFWQFRAGEVQTGITLHQITADVDAGPIVAQTCVPMEIGVSGAAMESRLAVIAVGLLRNWLPKLRDREVSGVAQDESAATGAPWPKPQDFRLDATWTVERAYRFLCGTADWGQPFIFTDGEGRQVSLRGPAEQETSSGEPVYGEGLVELQCADGVLLARGADPG
ncbi:MAG: hypothetical protein DRQ37_08245 [Gammaproteobacteria bacterium]|nr:MAG: hypothetical protein DRQ37_08245 [Gammaproteobacteria bacterium]